MNWWQKIPPRHPWITRQAADVLERGYVWIERKYSRCRTYNRPYESLHLIRLVSPACLTDSCQSPIEYGGSSSLSGPNQLRRSRPYILEKAGGPWHSLIFEDGQLGYYSPNTLLTAASGFKISEVHYNKPDRTKQNTKTINLSTGL